VADTFDALTTNRPYQQAHEVHDALKIIHSLSGKRLDPKAVFALDALYHRGEIRIQRPGMATQPAVSTASVPSPLHKTASAAAATTVTESSSS